ncbi:MAG: hypothetical protein ACMUIM_06045 [bacterium]
MKTPNKYVTIIFILGILYGLYNLASSSNVKKRDPKPIEATVLPKGEPGLGDALKGESGSENENETDEKERRKMLLWGRDPFIFPEGSDPYNKMKKGPTQKADNGIEKGTKKVVKKKRNRLSLNITAILISEDQKVATIDRPPYVVTIGDLIENEQVLEIMHDRVIFGRNGKTREIYLTSQAKSSGNTRGEK